MSGSTSVLLHDQSSLLVKNTKIGHKANLKKTDKLQMRSVSPGHQNRLSNCHDALTSGLSSVWLLILQLLSTGSFLSFCSISIFSLFYFLVLSEWVPL